VKVGIFFFFVVFSGSRTMGQGNVPAQFSSASQAWARQCGTQNDRSAPEKCAGKGGKAFFNPPGRALSRTSPSFSPVSFPMCSAFRRDALPLSQTFPVRGGEKVPGQNGLVPWRGRYVTPPGFLLP